LLLAFANYFISDCLWSAFFTSKRHKPFHHVKVAVHGEGARIGKKINIYIVLFENQKESRPTGKYRCRWEDNIKMNLKYVWRM
jgi:hypothetical protein